MLADGNRVDEDVPEGSSDRAFGFVFVAVLALVGAYRWKHDLGSAWWWGGAAVLAAVSIAAPSLLHPFNVVWTRFGLVLHKLVSPVILGLLYLFAIVPTAIVVRLSGKDLLRLARDPGAGTYWIKRGAAGQTGSMQDQF